jgi:hypothetical protein
MPGYASNQFWNFGKTYEAGKTLSRKKDDNANFIYPRPNQPDVYNPIRGKQPVDTRMQRGFLRGIYQTVGAANDPALVGKIKQRRLFFQFNPATIDRTVEMNAMVANPLLQDPSQIFQPVAGTAAFSFDLTFNREAEVVAAQNASTRMSNTGRWQTDTANPITTSLDAYGESTSHSDVASLGVLADLYVLDSIIGQSITPDTADFVKAYFSAADKINQANATTQGTNTTTNSDGSTTSTETKSDGTTVTTVTDTDGKKTVTTGTSGDSTSNFDVTGFETNIEKNYGNGAFLSPMPVRIVFSSLFMVEGYVESSSVRFAKFTKNYVPTVCAVTLTVRALYIGFAKEEAYLTTALKTAVIDAVTQRTQIANETDLAKSTAISGILFIYRSTSIAKNFSERAPNGSLYAPTLVHVHDYNSFYDFWNEGRWPQSSGKAYDGANIAFWNSDLAGVGSGKTFVSSAVSKYLQDKVKKGEYSWSFTARIILEEYLPDKITLVQKLMEAPIAYGTYGSNPTNMTDEPLTAVATNANKALIGSGSPRLNQYRVEIPDDGIQDGMPMFTNVNNIVKMSIVHDVAYTSTLSSGEQVTGTEQSIYDMFIVKTKKSSPGTGISWEDLDNNGLVLKVPPAFSQIGVPSTNRRSTPN